MINTTLDAYYSLLKDRENIDYIFSESGMVKDFPEFDFGFFPVGSGIFMDTKSSFDTAEIDKCKVMVLGNDFGTQQYVKERLNKREDNNRTVQNLLDVGLQLENTFFTNFYMGLRDSSQEGVKNTKRVVKLKKDYKDFCFEFFITQLDFIKPEIILCLGKEVGAVLSEYDDLFKHFNLRNTTFDQLYLTGNYIVETNNSKSGKRKFILIPHPSYAHINWGNGISEKIEETISA